MLASGAPTLTSVIPDLQPLDVQLSARLGDDVIIRGRQLPSDGFVARFTNVRLETPINLDKPLPGTSETEIKYHLPSPVEEPAALATWIPGFYNLALLVKRPAPLVWATNEVPFLLAPTISITTPSPVAAGDLIELTCAPRLREGQRVLLLFGDRQLPPKTISTPADPTQLTTLTFEVPAVNKGFYVVRLRVDGVDSLPVIREGAPPILQFDPKQTVEV